LTTSDRSTLFRDYCVFAAAHVRSGDIDPMYPVLRRFYASERCEPEVALWRTLLYVTWYHVGSASKLWRRFPTPRLLTDNDVRGLSTGTERRGFRGNVLAATHANAVLTEAQRVGGLARFFASLVVDEGEQGWQRARETLQKVPWLGPWASYKWADLLKHVHGFPITAADIGVGGASETAGPIPGMVRLTGLNWRECATNVQQQKRLFARARDAGVPLDGLDQLETTLCDFNSLCKGGYYVGHDIDAQMEHLKAAPEAGLWEARQAAFPSRYLGETSGWFGVRKELKRAYADKGEIACL